MGLFVRAKNGNISYFLSFDGQKNKCHPLRNGTNHVTKRAFYDTIL